MKSSIIFTLLLLPCIFISTLLAQESYFEKLYDDIDILYSVRQTTGDEYILSGLKSHYSENSIVLMKVDFNGDTIWTRDYPGMGDTDHYRPVAIQTSDNGYLLAGSTENDGNSDILLIKTDGQGETIWQYTYGDEEVEKCWSLQKTIDGGYLVGALKGLNSIFLFKLDSLGQIEWQKSPGSIYTFNLRYQIIQTADSGYVIASESRFYKLDQNGDSLWSKSFDHRYYLVQETSDNSLILAGQDVLLKTNPEGEEVWRQDLEIDPNDLLISQNEDIVLTSDQMIRLDEEGTEIWSLDLDGDANNIVPTNDGFAYCGVLPEIQRERRGWFVKTQADGYYKSLFLLQHRELPYYWYDNIQNQIIFDIIWHSHNIQELKIEYSDNNGIEWDLLEESYPAIDGTYQWIHEGLPASEGLIKISDTADPDFSDQTELPLRNISGYDFININDIKMYFSNFGSGSHNPQNDGPGLYWPDVETEKKTAIFQDGLLWSGKVNSLVQTNGNNHKGRQRPGNIFPDGSVVNPDSALYSIWKIRRDWGVYPPGLERDRLEHDYHNWPVDIGAPWIDHNHNGIFDPDIDQPKLYGDETNWFVMNDVGDYPLIWRLYGSGEIGLEIQCTIYGYDREDALRDVVFKKYRMINKGQNFVEDMYFGYWSDPDLGDAIDDFVGCDTLLNLAYCYNSDNFDGDGGYEHYYGSSPPAVGYTLLQGPIVPSFPTDSAFYNDQWITGYRNHGMTSFYLYINSDNTFKDPGSGTLEGGEEVYRNLQGMHWNGNPIIDPLSGDSTKFIVSGDPAKETGWYEGAGWPGGPEPFDRRMQIGTGPFNFAPGDTQEIVIAIILAQGEDHLDSVTKLKEKAAAIRQFYYTGDISGIRHPASAHPTSFRLDQNFPNPFNPTTAIGYRLSAVSKVDLSIYNVLGQKVAALVSEKQKAGYHQVEWDASRFASGVYFYILRAGEYRDVKKMVLLR